MSVTIHHGWMPDEHDPNDHSYVPTPGILAALPPRTDLRNGFSAVYHQGHANSCTANAVAAVLNFLQKKEQVPEPIDVSRLFIYYNGRKLGGTESENSAAYLRNILKGINKFGVCRESDWPYPYPYPKIAEQIEAIITMPPPARCYDAAKLHRIEYQRMNRDLAHLKACLADGYPFVFGFKMTDAFETPDGPVKLWGHLPPPPPDEEPRGGHAVVAVGYDDMMQSFLIRNSWGADWGIGGHFTMPYEILMHPHRAHSFWTIRMFQ
jgi:C1A family cysteine protease